eukprot:TRINITY_DN1440_c0_g1_i1.p1 TRINITY_DN1440_c0_g1~~TRINITY_DN1440_c0_g1_i1.p1  ORF type:complete len:583 (+),score=93.31 TRINITY_DN1440_c0_g1_i1:402-2150(+)
MNCNCDNPLSWIRGGLTPPLHHCTQPHTHRSASQFIVYCALLFWSLFRQWLRDMRVIVDADVTTLPSNAANTTPPVIASLLKKEATRNLPRRWSITGPYDRPALLENVTKLAMISEHSPENLPSPRNLGDAMITNRISPLLLHADVATAAAVAAAAASVVAGSPTEPSAVSASAGSCKSCAAPRPFRKQQSKQDMLTTHHASDLESGDEVPTRYETPAIKRRWEISADQISFGETLGEGGSGYVVKGEWRGIPVAVKKLKQQSMRKEQVHMFIQEIDMMSELRHPHIIQFLGASLEPGNMFFITQLAEKGNLHDCIVRENPSWKRRLQFARDIARGMNYLHQAEPAILHRDLKSMNVLIDENYKALLCDFGISRPIQPESGRPTGRGAVQVSGTYIWSAPDERMTAKSDVYSYGLVMWEILTGLYPFQQYTNLGQLTMAVHIKGERPPIPNNCDSVYSRLMQQCWAAEPEARPTFAQILRVLDDLYETLVSAAAYPPPSVFTSSTKTTTTTATSTTYPSTTTTYTSSAPIPLPFSSSSSSSSSAITINNGGKRTPPGSPYRSSGIARLWNNAPSPPRQQRAE